MNETLSLLILSWTVTLKDPLPFPLCNPKREYNRDDRSYDDWYNQGNIEIAVSHKIPHLNVAKENCQRATDELGYPLKAGQFGVGRVL